DAVGPDAGDRPACAYLQAIGHGPLHAALSDEAEFLESPLEVVPGAFADVAAAALLLFGHRAEEDVSVERGTADLAERGLRLGELCPVRGNGQRFLPAIRAISA